jgi:glutathione peroxidase-family protein
MEQVRSAAAMAGYADPMKLVQDMAQACNMAKTHAELDEVWKRYVTPVYEQLDEDVIRLLWSIYAKNATILMRG